VNDADGELDGDADGDEDAVPEGDAEAVAEPDTEAEGDEDTVAPLPGTDADAEGDGVNIAGCVDEGELVQPATTPTIMIVPAAARTFAGNGVVSI
jgi:hypothetical protein